MLSLAVGVADHVARHVLQQQLLEMDALAEQVAEVDGRP